MPEAISQTEPRSTPLQSSSAPRDLRTFVERLDQDGHLLRVRDPISWKEEIGQWTREHHTPLLFENVRDYPGQTVLTNALADPACIALALGLDRQTSPGALAAEARRRLAAPVAPRLVDTGPVLENIVPARDIDLFQLPVPQWSQFDAGRYIGTWHLNITTHPVTGVRNVGVYRMQLLSPNQTTVSASAGSGLTQHMLAAEAAGQPLRMAVAIGVGEALIMAASAALPPGQDELPFAGALQQAPVELVPGRSIDLDVPAHAEIVIEGFLHPGARVQDGPYFDYCGKTNVNPRAFLFEATHLLHRDRPIFRGTSIGLPGAEDHQLFAFLADLDLTDFHGSRLRANAQSVLLRGRHYRAFQFMGRLGSLMRRLK